MCFYLFINCVVILDIGGIVMHFRRGSLLYKLSLMLCAFSFYTASVCVCVCNPLSVSVCVCVCVVWSRLHAACGGCSGAQCGGGSTKPLLLPQPRYVCVLILTGLTRDKMHWVSPGSTRQLFAILRLYKPDSKKVGTLYKL